jgi:hypothetical protein
MPLAAQPYTAAFAETLKQGVNKRTNARCSGKDKQQPKNEQQCDHWYQPPAFT